jgi:hypothetical protein
MSLADPILTEEAQHLDRIFVALDDFPRLTELQRAVLFGAIDTAPDADAEYDHRAEYAHRWRVVREMRLGVSAAGVPITLQRASGDCSDPTPEDYFTALHNAKRMGA